MENSILKHFFDLCPDFDLFIEVVNSHDYENIDYKNILLFINNYKSTPIELNSQIFTYTELKEYCQRHVIATNIIDGIILLEKFNYDKISQIITLIENEDLIIEKIKDQFNSICQDKHITMLMPNFSQKFNNANKNELSQIFIKEAVATVIENCTTYNYLNNFIKDGMNVNEFQKIDDSF